MMIKYNYSQKPTASDMRYLRQLVDDYLDRNKSRYDDIESAYSAVWDKIDRVNKDPDWSNIMCECVTKRTSLLRKFVYDIVSMRYIYRD